MTTWQLFLAGWDLEPSVIIGCAGLILCYALVFKFRCLRQVVCFVAGVFTLLVALVSPIDTLADTYLFSAHMLQHILLILVVPPLLILGLPAKELRTMPGILPFKKLASAPSYPVFAWFLGVGTMWAWHWPTFYNAALASEPIHILEHLMFLGTAVIFWLPVISPLQEARLAPLWAVVYVFAACAAHTMLAILITFAPVGIYPAYLQPADTLHILPLLRDRWGLTASVDQQWGGLLMWVPACTVYLTFMMASMARWYRIPAGTESDADRALAAAAPILVRASVPGESDR